MQPDTKAQVLILGGTTQSRRLACALSHYDEIQTTTSFAGRTQNRRPVAGRVRVGGFNGIAGLIDYLRKQRIDLVVDATHAFANNISANALTACNACNIPRLLLLPPAWEPKSGDNWTLVDSHSEAVEKANAGAYISVFVAVGQQEIMDYAGLTASKVTARMIELPDGELPPNFELRQARGPFSLEQERTLFASLRIDLLICKNAGGEAGLSKLIAAREQKIAVVMLRRPTYQLASKEQPVATVADAMTKVLATLRIQTRV